MEKGRYGIGILAKIGEITEQARNLGNKRRNKANDIAQKRQRIIHN
jgi:hypothetical protein